MSTAAAPAVMAEAQAQEELFQKKFQKAVEEIHDKLAAKNDIELKKVIDDFHKSQQPPSKEEVQTLLDQEYLEFRVQVGVKGADTKRTFVIHELPQAVEKKFYSRMKEVIVNLASEIESIKMKQAASEEGKNIIDLSEPDTFKKILSMMNAFGPVLDVVTYAATLSLNPYGEDKEITEDWVRDNLGSTRILMIVKAQAECNRMRDFFSLVSRELNPPKQKNQPIQR